MTKIVKWEVGDGNKKYKVTLDNGSIVQFGDKRYEQYKDTSPLKLYSHKDHLDTNRRKLFKARHAKNIGVEYSAAWLSDKYLW